MILAFAAALAAAAPGASCPQVVTANAFVCRALEAGKNGDPAASAAAFEQAAIASADQESVTARMWAAAGNMWIAAGQPGKAALALERALAGTALEGIQRGEALLDRARAAEAQNDLKTARAKVTEAAETIAEDPFLWYFSAALAIREGNAAEAKTAIGRALALAPGDPTVLFEAGHVAHVAGEIEAARSYWTRAAAADPAGPSGNAAREALKLLNSPAAVQSEAQAAK